MDAEVAMFLLAWFVVLLHFDEPNVMVAIAAGEF